MNCLPPPNCTHRIQIKINTEGSLKGLGGVCVCVCVSVSVYAAMSQDEAAKRDTAFPSLGPGAVWLPWSPYSNSHLMSTYYAPGIIVSPDPQQ